VNPVQGTLWEEAVEPARSSADEIRGRLREGAASVAELEARTGLSGRQVRKILGRIGAVPTRPPARGVTRKYRIGAPPSDLSDLDVDNARRVLAAEVAAEDEPALPRPCRCEPRPLLLNGDRDCSRCGRAAA
jgi:hypothetical protein